MAGSLPSGTTAPRGLPKPELVRWPFVPARELFELKYGKALVEGDRRPGSVPVYGTNGQCGTHDTALFKGPGVVLGRKGQGPLGVEWCSGDYWVIDTAYALIPLRADVDLKYAYFLIKYVGLNHLKDGTSNPTLSRDSFGAQALPLPPLPEQRAIAHILGTLDDKIELNRRMNETLEAMARAILKS
jgi:type I restriction enzyme S subunit